MDVKIIGKVIAVALIASMLVSILSCGKTSKDSNNTIVDDLLINEDTSFHEKRLIEYETPYSLCYQNKDGTISLYIFPSPISYMDETGTLKLINTSLSPVKEKSYKASGYILQTNSGDIISYYPQKMNSNPIIVKSDQTRIAFNVEEKYRGEKYVQSVYSDVLGVEHPSISYLNDDSIMFDYYSTSTGTTVNITFNEKPASDEISFYIEKQPQISYVLLNRNTISMNYELRTVGIIRQSFLSDCLGRYSANSVAHLEEEGDYLKYSIVLENEFFSNPKIQYPVSTSVSFDIISNTLTNISNYSKQPNDIFSNYSIIGDEKYYGIGTLYLKFKVGCFVKSYAQNVKQATYNFVNLGGDSETTLEFNRLRNFWDVNTLDCELPQAYKTEGRVNLDGCGRYSLDITNYIQSCIYDDTLNTENYGLVVCNTDEDTNILANNNNSMYKSYVRIDFYDLPWTFENIDHIYPN